MCWAFDSREGAVGSGIDPTAPTHDHPLFQFHRPNPQPLRTAWFHLTKRRLLCLPSCGQLLRPDNAADLDHQVVLTIEHRNFFNFGSHVYVLSLWLKGGCSGSVVKLIQKRPPTTTRFSNFTGQTLSLWRQPGPTWQKKAFALPALMWPTLETRRLHSIKNGSCALEGECQRHGVCAKCRFKQELVILVWIVVVKMSAYWL
jgi:hypothetical protein